MGDARVNNLEITSPAYGSLQKYTFASENVTSKQYSRPNRNKAQPPNQTPPFFPSTPPLPLEAYFLTSFSSFHSTAFFFPFLLAFPSFSFFQLFLISSPSCPTITGLELRSPPMKGRSLASTLSQADSTLPLPLKLQCQNTDEPKSSNGVCLTLLRAMGPDGFCTGKVFGSFESLNA